jgi:hypothetical protein
MGTMLRLDVLARSRERSILRHKSTEPAVNYVQLRNANRNCFVLEASSKLEALFVIVLELGCWV